MTEKDSMRDLFTAVELVEEDEDRLSKQEIILAKNSKVDMLLFVKAIISQGHAENDLKGEAERILRERLNEDAELIPTNDIIRIIEVLSKSKNDFINNILGVYKEQIKVNAPQTNVNIATGALPLGTTNKEITKDLTPDEMNKIRNVLNIVTEMEKTEFPEKG